MKVSLQFIPYAEIAYLSSYQRVKKLISTVSHDKILLIQGRLRPEEETDLIQDAMKKIRKSRRFKGVELATFLPKNKNLGFFKGVREKIASAIFGDRDIFTVVGPATIVKEIKKDPTKLELFLK